MNVSFLNSPSNHEIGIIIGKELLLNEELDLQTKLSVKQNQTEFEVARCSKFNLVFLFFFPNQKATQNNK